MISHDGLWRAGGVMLIGSGVVLANGSNALVGLLGFALTIAGLVLAVQGRRVLLALRIERSRHRELPAMIHARRHPPRRD
jgi:hypothetical protein